MNNPNLNSVRYPRFSKIHPYYFLGVIVFVAIILIFYLAYFSSPSIFSTHETVFSVPEGKTLSQIAYTLEVEGFIKSSALFKALVIVLGGEGGVRYGEYVFKKPENVWTIARRMVAADFQLTPVRIVIPEGSTVVSMADIFEQHLTRFNRNVFIRIAKKDEGYLFPDSYNFFPNDGEFAVYKTLRSTFDEKIAPLQDDIARSGRGLNDIIIMASLLEKEARTTATRRTIAGILWKRLSIGMPLQVDAVFEYINGKNTYTLTAEDLQIDSPYNTYKYKGLPIGPIASPGLDSIFAALNPTESPYFYYLSDKEGNIYYSKTFEEHVAKKARYLR